MKQGFKDYATECMYGKGAIRLNMKLLMTRVSPCAHDDIIYTRTLVTGIAIKDIISQSSKKNKAECEMWEAEVIIIPIRKHTEHQEGFRGWEIQDKLSSTWAFNEHWQKIIFDRTEGEPNG